MTIIACVRSITAAVLILLVSAACVRNPYKVNVSGIKCDLSVRDLAQEIFETAPPDLSDLADTLRKEYGRALTTYSTVIGLGDPADEKWKSAFILFASDLRNLALWDDVKKVWPDLSDFEEGLEDAFRHYMYYFPDKTIPEVIACISVFNNSIITDDSLLMISLDRYLGSDSKYYPSLGIFDYQSRKMTPEYAVSDCIYAWAATEWDFRAMNYGTKNLMNTMLHEAKLLYFTKRMIPHISDTILFGFTGRQLEFCRTNEGSVWEYLISHDMLFSTDSFLIRKFTGEAPFTSYFTEESPGRAVVWTGFRIIERYMRNNPAVTLPDLMNMTDLQAILSGAKYSPE
ncbi:MAG: hypothetical protein MUC78_14020 [Bacteroidales bacterium]|jgi:hypothetical protein|nr:hypothetical protein [Bacteroidales bacterium]